MNYVKKQISKALLLMLHYNHLENISVSALAKSAEVSRASFYRNYKSLNDVLVQYFTDKLRNWEKENGIDFSDNFSDSLLNHFYMNKDDYLLLYKCNLSFIVYEILRSFFKISDQTINIYAYGSSTFTGSIFGWLDEWIRRGMIETPDELIKLSKHLQIQPK